MRAAWTSLGFLGLITLSFAACASKGTGTAEGPAGPSLAELQYQCAERGGVLAPTGTLTTRPAVDYNCRVSPAEPSGRIKDVSKP